MSCMSSPDSDFSRPPVAAAVAPGARRRVTAPGRRWFYVGLGLVAVVLSIVAFAPSIGNETSRRGPLSPVVTLHAVSMSAWLALYLAQVWLVIGRRLGLHKRLGLSAIVVAVAVVVTGCMAVTAMVRRGYDLSGDLSRPPANALDQTVFQFGALLIFVVLVGSALILRRRPEAHKRLMALVVIQTLMAAPLAHLVGHFQLSGVILPAWGVGVALTFIAYDRRTLGRIHPVSLWVGPGLVVVNNLQFMVIGPSETWRHFVAWIAR